MRYQHPPLARAALAAALAALAAALGGLFPLPARAQDDAPQPKILSATIVPDPIHPGEQVAADVATSPNVTSVEAHVKGMTFKLPEVHPGEFRLERTVPKIARFFKGTYHVTFVAHCAGGREAESAEDIVLN